jgi:hypothetical protein
MVEWHKEDGEMVSQRLIQSTTDVKKLQILVRKLNTHLRKGLINRVKATRFKDLERKMVTLSNPSKSSESIKISMETKDAEINILKSKLKIPQNELV